MQKKNVRAVGPILSLTKTDAAPIAAIVSLLTIQNGGFSNNKKASRKLFRLIKEAQTGFEPVDTGVADHCLTTWLLRHKY